MHTSHLPFPTITAPNEPASESAPPYVPPKLVPRLVPLPAGHTLAVKHPDRLDAAAFGDLREDTLQLVVTANVRGYWLAHSLLVLCVVHAVLLS
jgi:hypothetical protein